MIFVQQNNPNSWEVLETFECFIRWNALNFHILMRKIIWKMLSMKIVLYWYVNISPITFEFDGSIIILASTRWKRVFLIILGHISMHKAWNITGNKYNTRVFSYISANSLAIGDEFLQMRRRIHAPWWKLFLFFQHMWRFTAIEAL